MKRTEWLRSGNEMSGFDMSRQAKEEKGEAYS